MIKLSERFSFEQDPYQWLLHETVAGKDKDGNPKPRRKTTYHKNLKQIAGEIIDRTSGDCSSMDELIANFDATVDMVNDMFAELAND